MGDWITVTELANMKGVGPRRTRAILAELGFLVSEGHGRNLKLRLANWVTERGWGKRQRSYRGTQFDVIGPDGRRWIEHRWDDAVGEFSALSTLGQTARDHLAAFRERRLNPDMPVQEQVCWFAFYYPDLSQTEKARIIGVTQPIVSKYEAIRRRQLAASVARRNAPLAPKGSPVQHHD
ncbi:hypothetical protein [Devosia sp. Root685]|uniref:hypothetical protein n=1 Tax=Devosia sp. Root685 TaxID=1736587 RepID=UPI0012E39851|nr:hypothetical protein [Devosia sp. Root685]